MTLLLNAALALATGLVFSWVGWVAARRATQVHDGQLPGAQLAGNMFAIWWYGLAGSSLLIALNQIEAAFSEPSLQLVLGRQAIGVIAICASLAGLLHYLIYLHTGRERAFWVIVVGYAATCGWLLHSSIAQGPVGIEVTAWQVILVFERSASALSSLVGTLLLFGAPLAASISLLVVTLRAQRGMARLRKQVVAASVLGWLGGSTLILAAWGETNPAMASGMQLALGLLTGLAVLLTHQPPRWLVARFSPDEDDE